MECIGILLNKCKIDCSRCWFSSPKGKPTLVNIEIFNAVKHRRLEGEKANEEI